jgi:hypothetical protein
MPKRKTLTLRIPDAASGASEAAKPLTAARDGFSLNAALACKDHERDKLERLCPIAILTADLVRVRSGNRTRVDRLV